jgi:hypothetical protein
MGTVASLLQMRPISKQVKDKGTVSKSSSTVPLALQLWVV